MSSPVEDLVEKLRAASEDDVEAAMDCAAIGLDLEGVAPAALLEFFNCMLDRIAGERES